MTNILNLPNELLVHIFRNVYSEDIINLLTVCKNFYDIVTSFEWYQSIYYTDVPRCINFVNKWTPVYVCSGWYMYNIQYLKADLPYVNFVLPTVQEDSLIVNTNLIAQRMTISSMYSNKESQNSKNNNNKKIKTCTSKNKINKNFYYNKHKNKINKKNHYDKRKNKINKNYYYKK